MQQVENLAENEASKPDRMIKLESRKCQVMSGPQHKRKHLQTSFERHFRWDNNVTEGIHFTD